MPPTPTWQRAAAGLHELADDLDGGPTVRNLLSRGFDIQRGYLVAETNRGPYPIAPAFAAPDGGDIPKGLEQQVNQVRATLSDTYASAFTKWMGLALRPGMAGGDYLAWQGLSQTETNALAAGSDSSGGVVAAPTFGAEILARAAALSQVRQRAHIVPCVTDVLQLPAFTPNTSSPSTYTSDMLSTWAPEVPSSDTADPSFELFEVAVRKNRAGIIRLSEDLATDQPAALDWIATQAATELALRGDAGFIAGLGYAGQPRGLLNSGITTVDVEGSGANTISNSTSNAGSFPKIATLVESVPPQYRANPSSAMLASTTAEASLMKLIDSDGARAYRRPGPVEGLRLGISAFLEADGVDGNKVLLAGDFANYVIASRTGVTVSIVREAAGLAEAGRVGVLVKERIGGGAWNTDAFRAGVV
jgi:HK97 family phage major capsid protein